MGRYVNTFTNAANKYARDVVSGKFPAGDYVILACQRHLDDLRNSKSRQYKYKFDNKKVEKICKFASNLVHIKGALKNQKIILEPWQIFMLGSIFGWVNKITGFRKYNDVYAEIPRKNGKSVLGAIIGLYLLVADGEPGAEVYAGASTEDQAYKVFQPAWLMARNSPGFKNYFGLELGGTAKNPGTIYQPSTDSFFATVIGNPGDGGNVHGGIVDEYHEHKTDSLYDTLNTGMGARNQGLMFTITTAGVNLSGPCKAKSDLVKKILKNVVTNERVFAIIYSIDVDEDWTDLNNWKKANPNYGISVSEDFLKQQLFTAIQSASKQNIIRTKHLNQWLSVDTAWANMVKVQKCKNLDLVLEQMKGKKCVLGLDLASKIDLAALILLFFDGEKYYCFGKYYSPRATVEKPENTNYQTWEIEERLTVTEGERIDFSVIKEDIIEICKAFDVDAIAYDPFQATQLSAELTDEGLTMIETRATVLNFSEPMKELEALINSQQFEYDGCPMLYWMFSNVVAHYDKKENIYPNKERAENKIDGIVALIMALGAMLRLYAKPKDPTPGIFVI